MRKPRIHTLYLTFIILLEAVFLGGAQKSIGPQKDKITELRQEIMILNLINGLDLTLAQGEIILRGAEESRNLRKEFQSALVHYQEEMEAILEEIRTCLRENREIPLPTRQSYHRLITKIKKQRLWMDEEINRLALKIKDNLKSHQIYQLQQFAPCIIPPKGELRIGQTNNHKGLAMKLARIRDIPTRLYKRRKSFLVEKTLEGMKLHAPRGIKLDTQEMKSHIEEIFDRTRSLKETEFEVQKENLAEQLISPLKMPEKKNSLIRKIEGFLLSSEIIPILEDRIVRTSGLD